MTTPSKALDPDPQFTVGGMGADVADIPSQRPAPRPSSRAPVVAFAVLALVAGAGAIYYFWLKNAPPPPVAAPSPGTTAPPLAQPRPTIQHPIEKTPGAETAEASPTPPLVHRDVVTTIAT